MVDSNLPIVVVKDLHQSYGGVVALEKLSFSLQAGEVVGLLGPNGAGKTTALHILLGILKPSRGEVKIFGLDPQKHRNEIAKRIHFASAYVSLPSNLKVLENLKTFARLYHIPNSKQKIEELLEIFDMTEFSNQITGALSSGEKTRLNLCKCLLNDPELLLLDEPTASLDPEMADTVRKVLKRIQAGRKMAMIYTSHNMAEVEYMCDRILFIHRGKLQAHGNRDEILKSFNAKDLEEVFIRIVREGRVN